MNEVKSWAMVICLAAASCALLDMISPSGKMEKIIRFVFGAFMICAIINPFISMVRGYDFDLQLSDSQKKDEYKFSRKISDIENEVIEAKIKNLVEKTLNDVNIEPQKIDIFMDRSEEDGISINSVRVNLKKENADRQEEVKNMIKEKLGLECETVV